MADRINKVYVPALRNGDYSDYVDFLARFLEEGGKISKIVDDMWETMQTDLFVATEDCEVPTAHGAQAIKVIVPAGINVTSGGHNKIMRMDTPLQDAPHVTVDKFAARLLKKAKGITLQPEHFKQQPDHDEFLWQLDRINGFNLVERFTRARDNDRLTKPVLKQRLSNLGDTLDRIGRMSPF